MALGIAAFVLGVLGPGRVAGVKPTALLIADIRSGSVDAADAAALELRDRVCAGGITEDALGDAVKAILSRQADLERPWPVEAGQALIEWQQAGKVDEAQFGEFLINAVPLELATFTASLEIGEEMSAFLAPSPGSEQRFGNGETVWFEAMPRVLVIDGVEQTAIDHTGYNTAQWNQIGRTDYDRVRRWSPDGAFTIVRGGGSTTNAPRSLAGRVARSYAPIVPSAGTHRLRIEYSVEYGLGADPQALAKRAISFDREFEVHGDLVATVQWESDPDLARVLSSPMGFAASSDWIPRRRDIPPDADPARVWGVYFRYTLELRGQTSVPFAGDLVLRIDGREWPLQEFVIPAGRLNHTHLGMPTGALVHDLDREDFTRARLFFRPRATAAPPQWRTNQPFVLASNEVEVTAFEFTALQTPREALALEDQARLMSGEQPLVPLGPLILRVVREEEAEGASVSEVPAP